MPQRLQQSTQISKWHLECCLRLLLVLYVATTISSLIGIRDSVESYVVQEHSAELSNLSSVDYFACCGLGHRLVRMSLAHYIAKLQGFSIRSFWGWCGEQHPIEVFSYLFAPQTKEELVHVTSRNLLLPFYNEVPGFVAVSRNPNQTTCPCHPDKIDADLEFYLSLRNRFRARNLVDAFVKEHFQNKTVVGIHVRAGNGEGGDFERKGRAIENPRVWVHNVSQLIQKYLQEQVITQPPLLYIATDTPSIVALFRDELESANIPVLDVPQQGRREEGHGVLFGVADKVHNKDGNSDDDYTTCLKGWTDTLMDMFLLSHADVVVAAKPSSFSQTAPMSLAFGNQERKLSKVYCEVIPLEGSNITTLHLQCYDNYLDWCCNYPTWIKFHHKGSNGKGRVLSKEFVKFVPIENLASFTAKQYPAMRNRSENCPRPRRGRAGGGLKDKCLPYQW